MTTTAVSTTTHAGHNINEKQTSSQKDSGCRGNGSYLSLWLESMAAQGLANIRRTGTNPQSFKTMGNVQEARHMNEEAKAASEWLLRKFDNYAEKWTIKRRSVVDDWEITYVSIKRPLNAEGEATVFRSSMFELKEQNS